MTRWYRRRRWLAAALVLLLLGGLPWGVPAPVGAATCVVTNPGNSGANTLRDRLADAGCDTITFQAGLGAVTLTSRIDVERNVIVDGPGQVVQHSGGYAANGGLLWVTSGTVVLRGLTLQGGRTDGTSGGALTISGGSVTLDGATLRDNVARNAGGGGGIYASNATLRLTNTVVRDNLADNTVYNDARGGGGLLIDVGYGSVNVTIEGGSQILNNLVTGDNGGGGIKLWSGVAGRTATLTLTDAAVSGNTTTGFGGGLVNIGGTATLIATTISGNDADSGGGLFNLDGTATLTNTTVSANSAHDAGGLYNYRGTATLTNATITGNSARTAGLGGGGIKTAGSSINPATTQLRASIIAGNNGSTGSQDCASANPPYAPLTSQGYNVVGNTTGCPSNGTGDLAHTGALAALLNPALADNGGPTKTHDLPSGSLAIGRVPLGSCAVIADQRSVPRPQPTGGNCDSGAVEYAVLVPLTVDTVDTGTVARSPVGFGAGPFTYLLGTVVTLTPQPGPGQTFVGWTVDGTPKGWSPSLTLTLDAARSVQATFKPTVTFGDVGSGRADYAAIVALATRGTIFGYGTGNYGPDDHVQRAQMAALIARATPNGPDTAPVILTPPDCTVAGSWDCEVWPNTFQDRNGLDGNLWRDVAALQHYNVARGYDGAACAAMGLPSPCFAPTAPVSYVETITFVTRAMIAKGYWELQPGAPHPYPGVPTVFSPEVSTYTYYTGGAGGVPAPPANWNAGATRGWFARALWQALNTYWGTDGTLPDGRPAGGNVP